MVQHGQAFNSCQDEILRHFCSETLHPHQQHPGSSQPVAETLSVNGLPGASPKSWGKGEPVLRGQTWQINMAEQEKHAPQHPYLGKKQV